MSKYLGMADYPTESIKCECGLEQLDVSLFSDGDVAFSIMSSFLGKENSIWKSIWNVLKRKEVYYAEVILAKEKAIQFFEDCIKMITDNTEGNDETN